MTTPAVGDPKPAAIWQAIISKQVFTDILSNAEACLVAHELNTPNENLSTTHLAAAVCTQLKREGYSIILKGNLIMFKDEVASDL